MKYPDHLFEKYLSEAQIKKSIDNVPYLQFGHNRIPTNMIEHGNIGVNYSVWNLWMESFDNTQRAAIRDKLRALRVLKRLEAACSSTGQ